MARIKGASTEDIRKQIRRVIADPGAELVAAYYREPHFAGDLFDNLGDNDTNAITNDDLLAVSLLDTAFGPAAVRELRSSTTAAKYLKDIDPDEPLWGDIDLDAGSASYDLWTLIRQARGAGRTRTSKLMARKRPHLFPILDSVVCHGLSLGTLDTWNTLRRALLDEGLRQDIDGLWASAAPRPSTLRLLDVATWMQDSRSRNVIKAQQSVRQSG